ncbi:hypothetical protein CC86DRAFT_404250 [Ophiobolus disseminans]|uniref:Uncharacterized protein n=1 Tax=Ophiobolus disseminans TaxID=1469910 RepID=A0A6A7A4T8_9PLEO|nr:hypothetical protein CC86DRAFT_404250 [Ophiobolus disseminans]
MKCFTIILAATALFACAVTAKTDKSCRGEGAMKCNHMVDSIAYQFGVKRGERIDICRSGKWETKEECRMGNARIVIL